MTDAVVAAGTPARVGQLPAPRGQSLVRGLWSVPACVRAVRAAVIVPGVFALAYEVVGNRQMATYAAFGGFANLVLASFSGTRRDKLVAHLGLGLAGSALLALGTTVNTSTAVAALVTLVVTFAVLFSGVSGPNAAAGGTAVMVAYLLAAVSPGTTSMIPSRLEGWWLATAAATIAVVAMSTGRPGGQLRAAAAGLARALAHEIDSTTADPPGPASRRESVEAMDRLRVLFDATPYRPTGRATAEQALGNVIELLEWAGGLLGDTLADLGEIGRFDGPDSDLLAAAGEVLEAVAGLLLGEDAFPDIDRLDRLRRRSADALRHLGGDEADYRAAVHASFHARTVAIAVQGVATDALIATGRASPAFVAEERMRWLAGAAGVSRTVPSERVATRAGAVLGAAGVLVSRHVSVRSVWVRNSARGAVAVAAAVTVADLTNVQHGFWVVLGTLSVLRTTATATGATAVRAILGTGIGFVLGAALVIAVGTDTTVLWLVLPIAVLIAAYVPGVAPFAAGQAAFTVVVSVLYNLLIPVGWKVGVVRIEDVAIGCGVSLIAGALFWPRGASAVVVDDLYDAFGSGAAFLVEAAEQALGRPHDAPESGRAAVIAGLRLDDALRALLTEQGSKSVPKEDLWALVGAALRLRLTAVALAELPPPPPTTGPSGESLAARARILGDWYSLLATHLRRGEPPRLDPLEAPPPAEAVAGPPGLRRSCQLYVDQHLRHLQLHHADVIPPAARLAEAIERPWWHHTGADPRRAR